LLKVLAETRKLFINSPTEFLKSIHLCLHRSIRTASDQE
jgi:hypothetical protein